MALPAYLFDDNDWTEKELERIAASEREEDDYFEYLESKNNLIDLDFVDIEIGTCQGCGSYGTPGNVCIRNGEECGEYL